MEKGTRNHLIKPMYQVENPADAAMGMGKEAQSYGGKLDRRPFDPGPNAGGAIGALMGGAAMGNAVVPIFGGPVGAVLGLAGYLFS